MARLEWAWHRAFNAADAPPIDTQALGQVEECDRERIAFALPEGSGLLESAYPAHRIWEVNQEEYVGDATVDLEEGGVKLLIWRKELAMRIDVLDAAEWFCVSGIDAGMRFGELCSRLHAQHPHTDVGTMFANMMQRGWLASFQVPVV